MYVCSMITAASDTNGRMNRIIVCAGGWSLGLTMAGRAAVARQTLQERQAFPIKAAKGLLLQAPGHHSPQQVLAQTRRRRFAQKAEIEAVNAGWIDFFNKGDFAGVASLYAEDAVEGAARA